MSTQITTAFVQAFKSGIDHLVQQKGSRLRDAVRVESGITGKSAFFDQLGATTMTQRTTRHADTSYTDTPHARRMVTMADYDVADLIDDPDKVRLLTDPTNDYSQSFANAAGRNIDDVIIAAALGTSKTGETGSGSETWPVTGQQIAHGSEAITKAKVLAAKRILDANEVDDEDRYFVAAAKDFEDLLALTEVASSDYNSVKALVRGEIDTWLGFKWIRSERISGAGTATHSCFAFQKRALLLAIGKDSTGRVDVMPDKRYSTQVFYSHTVGATRMEGAGIVEVQTQPG